MMHSLLSFLNRVFEYFNILFQGLVHGCMEGSFRTSAFITRRRSPGLFILELTCRLKKSYRNFHKTIVRKANRFYNREKKLHLQIIQLYSSCEKVGMEHGFKEVVQRAQGRQWTSYKLFCWSPTAVILIWLSQWVIWWFQFYEHASLLMR